MKKITAVTTVLHRHYNGIPANLSNYAVPIMLMILHIRTRAGQP